MFTGVNIPNQNSTSMTEWPMSRSCQSRSCCLLNVLEIVINSVMDPTFHVTISHSNSFTDITLAFRRWMSEFNDDNKSAWQKWEEGVSKKEPRSHLLRGRWAFSDVKHWLTSNAASNVPGPIIFLIEWSVLLMWTWLTLWNDRHNFRNTCVLSHHQGRSNSDCEVHGKRLGLLLLQMSNF